MLNVSNFLEGSVTPRIVVCNAATVDYVSFQVLESPFGHCPDRVCSASQVPLSLIAYREINLLAVFVCESGEEPLHVHFLQPTPPDGAVIDFKDEAKGCLGHLVKVPPLINWHKQASQCRRDTPSDGRIGKGLGVIA